jgi:hypothetical protein
MTKTTIHCDVCGAAGAKDLQYFESREMGAAGSMENNYGHIDLCLEHAIRLLSDYDKHMLPAVKLPLIETARAKRRAA